MNPRFLLLIFTIFLKKWEYGDIKLIKNEFSLFFSSYLNILCFFYFLFIYWFFFILTIFSLFSCGLSSSCWKETFPIYFIFVFFFSIPVDLLIVTPFFKIFLYNIYSLLSFVITGKLKSD